MRRRGDDRGDQTRQQDELKHDLPRQHREHGRPVARQEEALHPRPLPRPLLPQLLQHDLDRIDAPDEEQAGERQGQGPMLEPSEEGVRGGVRRADEEDRVCGDVLVHADLVRQSMVLVVFVRPPHRRHASEEWPHEAEAVRPLVHAMDVVVGEPPGLSVTQRQQHHSQDLRIHPRRPRANSTCGGHGSPNRQHAQLLTNVALPPPLLL
mmetsp:Transcript_138289/g.359381  ORF Transcript_138289/g.359381 Transcript_138289/m.359381 type:complete len:208 (+) Transcript_138289:414-1037(+)